MAVSSDREPLPQRRFHAASGGSGADTLRAVLVNAVVNTLTGGAGDDKLKTREGTTAIDKLLCGVGTDQYDRDASDTITDCETSVVLP